MPDTEPRYELFAACAPGTEIVCRDELIQLGHSDARAIAGGVTFRGSLADAARANLWLRTANRVLLRVGEFDAPGRRELATRAKRLRLSPFLADGAEVRLHITAHKSALYHTGLITDVFHEATGLASAQKDAVAPAVFLRLEHDRCTVSVDTSGELLHRRGYRQEVSHAPLRETLAAAMLLLCRYDGSEALVDPMCGSGTIPIEAWLIATRRAPGAGRSFALESFPAWPADAMRALREVAAEGVRPLPALIAGSDMHAGALAAAQRNAERAGAAGISWERVSVAERAAPAERGLLLTNPPYGKRVGRDRAAENSVRALSQALDGAFREWRAGMLLPSGAKVDASARVHRLDNGGIPVKLVERA